jgi:hypothetical protein
MPRGAVFTKVRGSVCESKWFQLFVHSIHTAINKHCSTQWGGGEMAKNLSRLATKLLIRQFHKRPLSGSWVWIGRPICFLNSNERDLLTLFQLAHFFLLVPWHQHTVNSFQTGETAKKWFEEGALACLTLPPQRDGRTWGLWARLFHLLARHGQNPAWC